MSNFEAAVIKRFGKCKRSKGKNGIEYIVDCPLCGKKQKMYLNPNNQLYICFRCGSKGTLQELFGDLADLKHKVAPPVVLPLPADVVPPGEVVPLTELPEDNPAILYLTQRNFDPQRLNDEFGVRYCVTGETFAGIFSCTNTILFPLWMNGTVVGWQSRLLYNPDALSDAECAAMGFPQDEDGDYYKPPKYFTNPGLEKSRIFYNYDNARKGRVVVITEGPFDAIAVGKCAVATLGKGISDRQANLIKAAWDVAVIMLDPGDAEEEMWELKSKLHRSMPVVRVALRGYKDPGEAPREAIWEQTLDAAEAEGINLLDYKFEV